MTFGQRAMLLVLLGLMAMAYAISHHWQMAQERRESLLASLSESQQLAWEAALSRHVDSMQTLYQTHVHTPRVLGYQQQALDPQQRDAAREALWEHLAPVYRQLSERGLRQFIFHLPGGEVLLRFHRPDYYGDNLVPVRPSIEQMNRQPQRITGFELGRNYLGFRHLFPLVTPGGDTMGSVELALPFEVVAQAFQQLLPEREYELILAGEVVDRRLEPSRRALYTEWPGSGKFYLERASDVAALADPLTGPLAGRLSVELGRSEAARALLAAGEPGALALRHAGRPYVATFTPAKEVDGSVTGYMVSYQPSSELATIEAQMWRSAAFYVVAFGLLLLLALLLERSRHRRQEQQQHVQQAVEEANQRFELTMEATHTGLWSWDVQSNLVEWSELAYRQLGYAPGAFSISLERFQQLMHPDDLEPVMASIMRSVEQGLGFDVQFRLRTAEGDWCWIQGRGRVTERDAKGRPLKMMGTHTDINELKQSLQAVEQSEQRLSQLAAMSRTMTWETDVDGRYTYISHVAPDLCGYRPDELVGQRHFYELHPAEGRERFRQQALAMMAAHQTIQGLVNPIRHKTGHVVWVMTDGYPVLDGDGKLLGYRGHDRDITAQKEAELLSEQQLAFQRIATETAAALAVASDDTTFNDAIHRCLERLVRLLAVDRGYLFEFSEDLRLMSNTHEWCAPGVESMVARMQDLPTDAMPWWKAQFMAERRTIVIPRVSDLPPEAAAERREFEAQSIQSLIMVATHGEHGTLTGFMGFDSTRSERVWTQAECGMLEVIAEILGSAIERQRFEQRLHAERQQLLSIFNSIDEAIYIADPHTHELLYMNDFMARTFPANSLGQKCYRVIQGMEAPCDFCTNEIILANKGQVHRWEHYNPHLDRHYALLDRIIQWPDGRDVRFEFAMDITDRKRAEVMATEAKAIAERASRAKSQFLANMSHEIRTPLNAMLGMAELLSESELDATQRRHVETFSRSGEHLLALINDILDLARVESGRLSLSAEPFDPRALLNGLVELYQVRSEAKGLALESRMDTTVPGRLQGDPLRLRQILSNLIGNAIKFTEAGGVEISCAVEGEQLALRVSDSGIGIPADKLETIFHAFEQADTSTTRRFGGTGLGLTISRVLAAQMGGSLSVESEPGRGSRFTLRLPLQAVEAESAPPTTVEVAASEAPKLPERPLRILLAEDSPDNVILATTFLQAIDATVDVVEDGAAAVARSAEADYDAILMDVQMPILDGLEATAQIRAREQRDATGRVPIIALTAHAMPEDIQRSRNAGCDLHLSKPFRRAQLIEAIAKVVDDGRPA